jgi:hypothetical protein
MKNKLDLNKIINVVNTRRTSNVVKDIIDVIPYNQEYLMNYINDILKKSKYQHTVYDHELEKEIFNDIRILLETYIPEINEDWEFKVISVYTGYTIKEIKRIGEEQKLLKKYKCFDDVLHDPLITLDESSGLKFMMLFPDLKSATALHKLQLIAKVFNNIDIEDEFEYSPFFRLHEGKYEYHGDNWLTTDPKYNSYSINGFIRFKTHTISEYVGKTFKDIYLELFGI